MTDAPKRMTQGNPLTGEIAEYLRADLIDMDVLRRVMGRIEATRKIVASGAETGFNCLDGDWAERLYQNNAELTAALADLRAMMEKINE